VGSASAVDFFSSTRKPTSNPTSDNERASSHRSSDRGCDANTARWRWIEAFSWRTCGLRPETAWAQAESLAIAAWPELSGFDPGIAAELEHESRDDPSDRGAG